MQDPNSRWQILGTCVVFVVTIASVLGSLFVGDGAGLTKLGTTAPILHASLDALETYLASPEHRAAERSRFSIALLGDSSSGWKLPAEQRMEPVLRSLLTRPERERFEVYGLMHAGLGSYDFYFLLNRLVAERPDLLILPVNLRSFGRRWLINESWRFTVFQGYVLFTEFPRAKSLSFDERPVLWSHLLLYKFDRLAAGGQLAPFLNGIKRSFGDREEALLSGLPSLWPGVRPMPERLERGTTGPDPSAPVWDLDFDEGHPILRGFRAVNGLAADRGVRVLYYALPLNERASGLQRARVKRAYDFVRSQIADGPGVDWLDLSTPFARARYSDRWEHYDAAGVRSIASRILDEVRRIDGLPSQ